MSETLWCPLRKKKVKKTPEELVRQGWIFHMTSSLGYPQAQMAIERPLKVLGGGECFVPDRRPDLLVFDADMRPLLVFEFKKGAVTKEAALQAAGYNYYLKAPFFAVAGACEVKFGRISDELQFLDFLPVYTELVTSL